MEKGSHWYNRTISMKFTLKFHGKRASSSECHGSMIFTDKDELLHPHRGGQHIKQPHTSSSNKAFKTSTYDQWERQWPNINMALYMYTDRESDTVYCITYRYTGHIKSCITEEGAVASEGVVACWFPYRPMKEPSSLNLVGSTSPYSSRLSFSLPCGPFSNSS